MRWTRRAIPVFGQPVGVVPLAAFMAASYAALVVGSSFTRIDAWYDALEKPPWTPPGWVIGAVWTVLYTLIGIAGGVAWSAAQGTARKVFVAAFGANLVLNAGWSLVFFTLQEVAWAVVEITALAASTIALAILGYRARPLAGLLLAPYAVWVVFAGTLNFTIWRLAS